MDAEKQDPDIVVQIINKFNNLNIDLSKLKKLVKGICCSFEVPQATISIAIVGDAEIREVNNKFLNHNCPTDCLSFNLSDDDVKGPRFFELVVNAEKAVKEASQRGHSNEAELALYVTHGLLHNLGFEDSQQVEAKKMHDAEDEILRQFGYGSVYNKDSIDSRK